MYLGLDDGTGGLMAVKEVEFQRSRQDMVEGLRHEIDILRCVILNCFRIACVEALVSSGLWWSLPTPPHDRGPRLLEDAALL